MLAGSKRISNAVPVRSTFVQQGRRGSRRRGPLADFVSARDEIALDLLLLALASASAPPHDVLRPTEVWLRALGRDPRSKSSAAAVSRAWKRLEERRLITRVRQGRLLRVELRREDGSGDAYAYPTGSSSDLYFKLPFAYWTENLHNTLTLRAKTMLLIGLSLPDGFVLPYERVPDWYGVSADTAQRGFRELSEKDLLEVETGYKAAPLTAQGWTEERRYTLHRKLRAPVVRTTPRSAAIKRGTPVKRSTTPVSKKRVAPTAGAAKNQRLGKRST